MNTRGSKCTPTHIPLAGYVSLNELNELASAVRSIQLEPEEQNKEPLDKRWFFISMSMVKWLGVAATCLTMIFFTIVILKAFLS